MDNINDFAIHFSISSFMATILQVACVGISIIIFAKRPKSIGAKILLAGTILSLLSLLGSYFLPFLSSKEDTDTFMRSQVVQLYFGTFSFFVFTLGFLLFAIIDLKKEQISEDD